MVLNIRSTQHRLPIQLMLSNEWYFHCLFLSDQGGTLYSVLNASEEIATPCYGSFKSLSPVHAYAKPNPAYSLLNQQPAVCLKKSPAYFLWHIFYPCAQEIFRVSMHGENDLKNYIIWAESKFGLMTWILTHLGLYLWTLCKVFETDIYIETVGSCKSFWVKGTL